MTVRCAIKGCLVTTSLCFKEASQKLCDPFSVGNISIKHKVEDNGDNDLNWHI